MAKTSDRELELDLRSALIGTGHITPIKIEITGSRIEVLCREIPGMSQMWLKDVWGLLVAADGQDINMHLCKKYVLKNGSMVFGWHVGIDSKNARALKKDIDWFCTALKNYVLAGKEPPRAPKPTQPVEPRPSPSSIMPSGAVIDPNFKDDMDVRREAAIARTTASPRTPEYSPDPPSDVAKPRMTTIQAGTMVDSRNKSVPVIIQEMPLPFTYTDDMNKPNDKGRGAKGGVK